MIPSDELFADIEGNTPLAEEERTGLIPALATRAELNEWERENILVARRWALAPRQLKRHDPLTDDYLRRLHRKMFDHTWRWAGTFRGTERNLGLPVHQLATEVRVLLDDARYWLEHAPIRPTKSPCAFITASSSFIRGPTATAATPASSPT